MEQQQEDTILAAVDLGSNSFHMIIARLRDGHFQVMDRLREMVQLRAGLDKKNRLNEEAEQRALACLERFGQRLRDLPESSVRIVGTNTLRIAKDSHKFLKRAKKALGHPIEVVAGEEEARLIYLGVAHSLAFDDNRRFVMDIGGGSTEFIIGERHQAKQRESLDMGCVSFSEQFFPGGTVSAEQMKQALMSAGTQLRAIRRPFRNTGWLEAIGASGTIRCVGNIIRENGWSEDGVITADGLTKLVEAISAVSHVTELDLAGLTEERKGVLPGGVAILKASFDHLKIDRMIVSDGALREGLLYDLLGRIQHDDERDRTVLAFARRYQVDEQQAKRVADMALELFDQVADAWRLDEEHKMNLLWAAQLHEVGLSITHEHFQKHSHYLLANSSLPGFSREEQSVLAVLVLGQRKRFPKKELKKLPVELRKSTKKLAILLRLAIVFNRGRSEVVDTFVELKVYKQNRIKLKLPEAWLDMHRLTEADLLEEQDYLDAVNVVLEIS